MNVGIKGAFLKIKEEMNLHLDAINQNTNEVQSCYEYLAELDKKVEKLSERLDALQVVVCQDEMPAVEIRLSHREQEAFLVLYAVDDPLTSLDIGRRLGFSVEMVEQYLHALISKGVPVLKTFVNGKIYHSLDLKFKDLQTRKNILGISEAMSQQLLTDKAI
jgi:hypothetical protein